jgi:hypothetical protein
MATQRDKSTQQTEEAVERIRELNEQILKYGREWGAGFLDAYEANMRAFADFQEKTGEGTDIDWISRLAKAQADFTREVTKLSTSAARRLVQ